MGTSGGSSGGGSSIALSAAALGLKFASMDWMEATTSSGLGLSSGVMFAQLIRPGAAVTVTKLGTWLTAGGATSGGVNAMALYTAAGVLIDQTADMTALFSGASPSYIEAALGTPRALTADTNYYVACLTHLTTIPKIAGNVIGTNAPVFLGNYPALTLSAQASFPASFTPSAAASNNGAYFFTGS